MSFFSRKTRPATSGRSPSRTYRRQLELLEDRCLLSAGTLDPSFGSGGIVTAKVSTNEDTARAVTLQTDGKVVVAGTTSLSGGYASSAFVVIRYNTNGSLDSSFGSGGKTITEIDSRKADGANAVAIDYSGSPATNPNYGKIYAAGWVSLGNPMLGASAEDAAFALVRYNANGTLDTTFGGTKAKGKVITNFTSGSEYAYGVAVQPDGKIVVTGVGSDIVLARYNANGTLDSTFGNKGKVTTDDGIATDAGVGGMVLQADGKVVVVGRGSVIGSGADASVLARYNGNGSLDNSFGTNGLVTTFDRYFGAIALQPDGKLVVGGTTYIDSSPRLAFARFDTSGVLDTSFVDSSDSYDFETGQQGWAINNRIIGTGNNDGLWHLSTRRGSDANHSPVTSFYYGDEVTGNYDVKSFPQGIPTSVRNAGAIVSPSFVIGTDASVSFKYFLDTERDIFLRPVDQAKLQVSNDGGATWTDLLGPLAESSVWINATASLAAFAGQTVQIRFFFDTIDDAFNTFEGWYVDDVQITGIRPDGTVVTNVIGTAKGVAVDSAGRIVAAGWTPGNVMLDGFTYSETALLRLNPDGSLDTTFGTGGKVQASISQFGENANGVVIQADGKIVTAGYYDSRPSASSPVDFDIAVARYLGDPLLLAASMPVHPNAATISAAAAQSILVEAIRRWNQAGADTSGLGSIQVQITNLGGATLGMAGGNTIWLDDNAAGWGWFVDPTPWNDGEFAAPGNLLTPTPLPVGEGQRVRARMDLLSVLMHEIGHLLGQDHDEDGVMAETLAAGTRLTPLVDAGGWLAAVDLILFEPTGHKRRW